MPSISLHCCHVVVGELATLPVSCPVHEPLEVVRDAPGRDGAGDALDDKVRGTKGKASRLRQREPNLLGGARGLRVGGGGGGRRTTPAPVSSASCPVPHA